MNEHPLLRSMIHLGGFEGVDVAEPAARGVLSAMRAGLPDEDASALAGALGEPLARILREGAYERPMDLAGLRDRVVEQTGLYPGRAVEVIQVVCRALREVLPEDAAARLRPLLPEALRPELDEPSEPLPPPVPERHERPDAPGEGRTLATGRPGSRHPLSEAAPRTAHSQSVARNDDPHGDTKLSGARGLTQERLHESLAEGHPGPEHTLSGDRDRKT